MQQISASLALQVTVNHNQHYICFLMFREWYEPHAVLMQEEGTVISGLLVGINIIDCNFDLKGDSLDAWVRIFHMNEDFNLLQFLISFVFSP